MLNNNFLETDKNCIGYFKELIDLDHETLCISLSSFQKHAPVPVVAEAIGKFRGASIGE